MSVREVSLRASGGGGWRTTRGYGLDEVGAADDLDARFRAFMSETDEYDEGEEKTEIAVERRSAVDASGTVEDDETAWAEMLAAESAATST